MIIALFDSSYVNNYVACTFYYKTMTFGMARQRVGYADLLIIVTKTYWPAPYSITYIQFKIKGKQGAVSQKS